MLVNRRAETLISFFVSCGLLYLNRADLIVLIAPFAAYILARGWIFPSAKIIAYPSCGDCAPLTSGWQGWGQNTIAIAVKALAVGSLPVVLWTVFSIYYYGFPFPNTAYAKLATGIALADRVSQGYAYFLHFAQTDPLSCFTILIGIALGLERRNSLAASISIGILFYLAFVLSIGGDFMEGRFFTAPLLMATIQIARLTMGSRAALVAIITVVSLGFFNINQTLLSGATYSNAVITKTGISDERGVYFQGHGLITGKSDGVFSMRDWSIGVKDVEVTCGGLGFKSLYRGPSTHYIDTCALTDPLPPVSDYMSCSFF